MSEQFKVGELKTVETEDLVAISNVRIGELPGIQSLADSMKQQGQLVSVRATPVVDYVEAIQSELPNIKSQIDELKSNLEGIDDKAESKEVQGTVDKLLSKEAVMNKTLQALLQIPEDDRENTLAIVDGHRRVAAAVVAEIYELRVEIVEPKADPAELLMDQFTMGTTGRTLTVYEQARAYEALRNMNLTSTEIAARMGGVSRDVIRQRLLILPIVERAEALKESSPEASEFLTRLDAGELRSRFLNKVGMYNDKKLVQENKDPLTDDDFAHLLEESYTSKNYDVFKNFCNDTFGSEKSPTPRQNKGPKEEKEKEKEGESRRRPDKELRSCLAKNESLLRIAVKKSAKDGSSVTKSDVMQLEANVASLQYMFGGADPVIPESMVKASIKFDEIKAEEEEKEKEEKKSKRSKESEGKKEEKKKEADVKKKERSFFKELYNATVKSTKSAVSKTEKRIDNNIEKIKKIREEKKEGFEAEVENLLQSNKILDKVLSTQRATLTEAVAEFNSKKPDWLIEEEAKREASKVARAEKKLKETEEGKTEGDVEKVETQS